LSKFGYPIPLKKAINQTKNQIEMKSILLFLCLLLSLERINAQESQALCGFDQIYQAQLRNDPAFRQRMKESAEQWQAYIADKNNTAKRMVVEGTDTIYEIPIVVHVINTGQAVGTAYNRSDADIISWIDYTNKVWAATWPAYPNTSNGGAKIPIRFVLARRSPTCTTTNGIDRVDGSVLTNYVANGLNVNNSNGVTEAQVRNLTRWNPSSYYNIYVVNRIDGQDGITTVGAYIAGYAYFAGSPSSVDGAFMLSSVVGTSDQTLPHEMGHAMGLYHTFQGATGNYPDCGPTQTNCNTDGDLICDTEWSPNNLTQNPCPTNANTNPCTMLPYNNVQYNIMNYGVCRNRFTAGQADRAKQQLLTYRTSLINSVALDTPLPAPLVIASACSAAANANPSNSFNIGPANVILNNINYTSAGYSGDGSLAYIDHTLNYCTQGGISTNLIADTTYALSVSTVLNPQRIKVFIDYNNSGTFDSTANEEVMYLDNAAVGNHTVNITPPLTAVQNTPLRLRVMSDGSTSTGTANYGACSTLTYGQVEDFYVTILSNIPTAINYISKFTANASSCSVGLNWTFSNKQDAITSFILERSNDAKLFTALANIGTQNNITSYNDLKPFDGTNYYRLKWINADNSVAYSSIQRADVHCDAGVKVYPNPFKSQFTLAINAGNSEAIKMEVYDVSGKKVWSANRNIDKGISKINIDLSSLSDAIYILKVNGNDINNQMMVVKSAQ